MPSQPNQRELDKLISIYLKAETDIINEIARLRSQGLIDYHAVAALERVQAILNKMQTDSWEYIPRMIEKMFYVRVPEARKKLDVPETPVKHFMGYVNAATLTSTQTDIVQKLALNLATELSDASVVAMSSLENALIGRRENDVFRRVGLELVANMQATGRSTAATVPEFVKILQREGVTAFVDKAGRNWSLHTYASMVTRTTSRQAEVLAVLTADPEHDLYKISSHGTTCALCAPYEGRVYSKSGTNPDFPPLAAAFGKIDPAGPDDLSNTWLNIHPNCLHVLMPWTAAGRTPEEIQEIKDFSNPGKNPFTVDPRSQKQIEAYRDKEKARTKWLDDYRQFERYRVTIPENTPKTFNTFLKHKTANDDTYKIWKLDYRRRSELLAHPERALPGAAQASAADAKFTGYFFNPESKDGWPKGMAFSSRLGYNKNNWELFRQEIQDVALKYPATYRKSSEYGKLYSQLVILHGVKNSPANVLLGWIVKPDGSTWLTTAHMEEF